MMQGISAESKELNDFVDIQPHKISDIENSKSRNVTENNDNKVTESTSGGIMKEKILSDDIASQLLDSNHVEMDYDGNVPKEKFNMNSEVTVKKIKGHEMLNCEESQKEQNNEENHTNSENIGIKDKQLEKKEEIESLKIKKAKEIFSVHNCTYDEADQKILKSESKVYLSNEKVNNNPTSGSIQTRDYHFENHSKETIKILLRIMIYLQDELKYIKPGNEKVIPYLRVMMIYFAENWEKAKIELKLIKEITWLQIFNKASISALFNHIPENQIKELEDRNKLIASKAKETKERNQTERLKSNQKSKIATNKRNINKKAIEQSKIKIELPKDPSSIKIPDKRKRIANINKGITVKKYKLNGNGARTQNLFVQEPEQNIQIIYVKNNSDQILESQDQIKKRRDIANSLIDDLFLPKNIIDECSIKVKSDVLYENELFINQAKKLFTLESLEFDKNHFASIEVTKNLYYTVIYKMTINFSTFELSNNATQENHFQSMINIYQKAFPPLPIIENSKFFELDQNLILLILVFITSIQKQRIDIASIYLDVIKQAHLNYFPNFSLNAIEYCFRIPKNLFFYYLFIDLLYNQGNVFDMYDIEMKDGWDKIDLEDEDYKNFIKFKDENLFRDCYQNKNIKFTFNFLINQIVNQDKIFNIVKHLGRKKSFDKNIEEFYKKTILDQSYRKKKK